MKKLILLTCLLLSAVMTFAQTKKVAILEVVDRQGNIAYAHKLILRTHLAKAIINLPGYEAYDRTDIDAIMSEHNFQRTGLVSSTQIKQLGEMTGAQYILVAEAAKIDDETMYITVKILDVVTAKTEATENLMMGVSPTQIKTGCEKLANKLFGNTLKAIPMSEKRTGRPIFLGINGTIGGIIVNSNGEKFGVVTGNIGLDVAFPCTDRFAFGFYLRGGIGYTFNVYDMPMSGMGRIGVLMLIGDLYNKPFLIGITPFSGIYSGSHAQTYPLEIRFGRAVSQHFYLSGNLACGFGFNPGDQIYTYELSLTLGYHFGDKLRLKK